MRRLLLPLLVALGACAETPEVPTARVVERAFAREIVAEGHLQAKVSIKVTAPLDVDEALRLNWIVPDGTPVVAGDVIARFDETPWRRELETAEGELAGVALKRDRHGVGRRSDEVRSELDVGVARAELAHAERFQARDEEVFSRNERIQSELDAGLARRKEEHALEVRGVQRRIAQGEGRLIDLEGEQAGRKRGRAEKGLAALTAVAPSAGLAVLLRGWRGIPPQPGDTVWPGQPIAEIPDLSTMQAEIFVLEADAGGLEPGQAARIRLEARGGAEVAGTVERVDKVAKPRQRNAPVQYFGATLALAATDPETKKPGQRVVARVSVVALPRALVAPRTAVFENGDARRVFRRRGAGFEPVEVEVLASGNGLVALGKGVAPGDELALVDPQRASRAADTGDVEAGEAPR
jgi:hypothetical protein